MALNTFISLAVTDAPVQIAAAKTRQLITIANLGPAIVFLGKDSSVSYHSGFPLFASRDDPDKIWQDALTGDAYWVVCTTGGTADVRAVETA